MNLIFVGPQGSGKGTQAEIVSKKLGLCHISAGDLLRGVGGEDKELVEGIIRKGDLVPNEVIERLLLERVKGDDCSKGIIFDGYPRNVSQVDFCIKNFNIDKAVEIFISDEEAVRRINGRRSCPKCGAIYNIETAPKPKVEGVCDKCGARLVARKDDNEEVLRERLRIYHEETEKVLDRFDSVRVNGEQSIEKVTENILELF